MNVVNLPDRLRADASRNLNLLIERARNSKAFAGTIKFDDSVWDISAVKIARPSARSKQTTKLYFSIHSDRVARGAEGRTFMHERFASFLKAMIVLLEEERPSSAVNYGGLLRAARSLYVVFTTEARDPVDLVSADFMAACNDIKTRKTERGNVGGTPQSRHVLGNALCRIAEFINRHSLSKTHISFFNPFPVVACIADAIDQDGRVGRSEKMASQEEIGAIVDASIAVRNCGNEADLLCMCVVELMCCAPVRINEVLDTRSDCARSGKIIRKTTGDEIEYLGYAYNGSKKAPDSIKYVPSVMVDIADRALADALRITEPFRRIARWMESHPGRAYLAEPFRLADPETLLSHVEVGQALGLKPLAEYTWLERKRLRKREGRATRYRLGDIEEAVLREQPKLPNPKAKLSDYMFIVPKNYFHAQKGTQDCVLMVVGDYKISHFLGCHPDNESVFQKFEILDDAGKPYRIITYSVRHFLNTLAQEGRLSQLDIARWSGRKDVRQNAVYDHSGGIQLGRDIRRVLETDAMRGPIVDTAAALKPADRETFLSGRFATAHFTSIGACIQDFSLAPCPSHGACAGCSEHLIVKGKPEHLAEAERLIEEHQAMLDAARTEMAEGTYNASAWVEHNERVLDGLKKAVAVHNDPEISSGTIVQI